MFHDTETLISESKSVNGTFIIIIPITRIAKFCIEYKLFRFPQPDCLLSHNKGTKLS